MNDIQKLDNNLLCPQKRILGKSDWKTEPLPYKKEDLGYENFFSDSDAETLLARFRGTPYSIIASYIYCPQNYTRITQMALKYTQEELIEKSWKRSNGNL